MNIQGGFPLGLTGLISLLSKGFSRVFSSTTSILQCYFLYGSTLTSIHNYGKDIALIIWTFVSKVMSLLFKTLSSFVIAFLSKSKCLLILGRQSLSAVILECKKIRSVTVSTFSPSICHEVMGLDAMILVFEYWVFSQFFHSPRSTSSRGSLVPPRFLQLWCYHLHMWGCWYFSQQSRF